jgi:uncharacterized protein YcbK (DUF882 family)
MALDGIGGGGEVGGASYVDNDQFKPAETPVENAKKVETQPEAPQGSFEEKNGFNQADVKKAELLAKTKTSEVAKLDKASEARLAKVNPELAKRVRATANDLKAQGINVRVTDGFRSVEEQNKLYAQGRTAPGKIVTKAKGGSSNHNYGLAVDLVPIVNGKADYKVSNDTWNKIGAAGKKNGLEWGGDFKSIVDKPHFQLTGGNHKPKDLLPTYNKGGLPAVWDKVNKNVPAFGNSPTTETKPTTTPKPADQTTPTTTNTTTSRTNPKTPAVPAEPTTQTAAKLKAHLEKGYRGQDVKELQNKLVNLGYMTKAEMKTGPGIFGPRTQNAVKAFQNANGLDKDGVVGPGTRSALNKANTKQTAAVGQVAPPTATTTTNPTATTASAAKINGILKGTNMAGKGELISDLSKKYNVPPELALSMFRMEAGFARTGTLAEKSNNPGNIKYVGQEGASKYGVNAKWDSMDKGIEAYFKLLNKGYRSFIDNKDYNGLINKYAPPVENNTNDYIKNIKGWMNDYRTKING